MTFLSFTKTSEPRKEKKINIKYYLPVSSAHLLPSLSNTCAKHLRARAAPCGRAPVPSWLRILCSALTFTHISLHTISDKYDLILINKINHPTTSREKLCTPRVCPSPCQIPCMSRIPLHAVMDQTAPCRGGWLHKHCLPQLWTASSEKHTLFCPSNPVPKPLVLFGALSSNTVQIPSGQDAIVGCPMP